VQQHRKQRPDRKQYEVTAIKRIDQSLRLNRKAMAQRDKEDHAAGADACARYANAEAARPPAPWAKDDKRRRDA
jgi:hypothetical protein